METLAVVRLSLPNGRSSASREDFWRSYWEFHDPNRSDVPTAVDSERALAQGFAPKLARLLSNADVGYGPRRGVEIVVRGIRYGSIELLLTIFGGEELASEMFWALLEFYAPEAANEAVNGDVPLTTHVTRVRGGHGGSGEGEGRTLNRVLTASRSPLIAFFIGALIVIYLLMWRLESLEKEHIQLYHDHTALVGKMIDQNSALITGLLSKLDIISPPPERDEHEHEGEAAAPTPSVPVPTQSSTEAPNPTAQPTQASPSPMPVPTAEPSLVPGPKAVPR
jgi:hypothetical protein